MAKTTLPVNYKDDVLTSSMDGKRRYRMINNTDGTVSFEDATTYTQIGSNFGAANLNATNGAVNAAADASKIIDNVNDIKANTQAGYMMGALAGKQLISDLAGYKFGTTSDGKPGYIMPGGADTVIPFKSHTIFDASVSVGSSDASSVTVPLTKYYPNYSKITAANIFVKYKNGTLMGYAKTGGSSFSSVLGLSYNNSTGNLTISNAGNNTAGGFYYYRGSTQVFTICIVP